MIQRLLVIPDCQVKPDVSTTYLDWINALIKDKKPEVIVQGGDFYDMPSLSSWDKGKKSSENRRIYRDIAAGSAGLERLTRGIVTRTYSPKLVATIGNHCNRIMRYVESNPELEGTVGYHLLDFKKWGWKTYDFLEVVTIGGVAFSHFFPRGANGRITQTKHGAPSARAQAIREGRSCVGFHQQGLDTAIVHTGNKTMRGIIAGSCYTHDEAYLSPQGHKYWKGVLMLHQVKDGNFNICEVDLAYLKRRYG